VNAKAAFYILAAAGSLTLAVLAERPRSRLLAVLGAALFAAVPLAGEARAATAVLALLPVAGVLALVGRGKRLGIAVLAGLFVAALALTVWLAAAPEGSDAVARARELFGARRVALWQEAYRVMGEEPLIGVGPDRFEEVTPLARDPDASWAHHGFLQQGAETGVAGLALLVLVFLWGFARLWVSPAPPGAVILGAYGLGVLGVVACFDYVLHFPMVTIAAGLLVGSASGRVTSTSGGVTRSRWDGVTLVRKVAKAAVLPFGLPRRRQEGDVVILLYHRVQAGDGEISLPFEVFARQVATIAQRERVLTLDEALRTDRGGVVVTFDDGFRDFHEHVLPILAGHHIPATLYLATGLVEDGPSALTWGQLAEATSTGLVTVGSHTHSHADLSRASVGEAEDEMRRSKDLIEDRLAAPCRHFAYPWAVGSAAAEHVARRLFDSAAKDAWRTNRRGAIDPHRLGRVPILCSDGTVFFRAKVAGMLDSEFVVYRLLRRGPWRPS
jgi:hypothetical protein